jgi:hypothetical protein
VIGRTYTQGSDSRSAITDAASKLDDLPETKAVEQKASIRQDLVSNRDRSQGKRQLCAQRTRRAWRLSGFRDGARPRLPITIFGPISELVVIVRQLEHHSLSLRVFHEIGQHAHFGRSVAPVLCVVHALEGTICTPLLPYRRERKFHSASAARGPGAACSGSGRYRAKLQRQPLNDLSPWSDVHRLNKKIAERSEIVRAASTESHI